MAEATTIERAAFTEGQRVRVTAQGQAVHTIPAEAKIVLPPDGSGRAVVETDSGEQHMVHRRHLEPIDAPPEPDPDVVAVGSELVVVADDPAAMVKRQADLAAHVRGKMAEVAREIDDARVTIEHAMNAGVNTASLKTIVRRAESRHLYLSKIAEALEAGYLIMPNMDARTIAIRIADDTVPGEQRESSKWSRPQVSDVTAESLPTGEGHYVSPHPKTITYKETTDTPNEPRYVRETTGEWSEELPIPIEFMKPTILKRFTAAKARKIFDDFGVLPHFVRKREDPIIVGRINDPRNKRTVSFLVAWFVDTRAI